MNGRPDLMHLVKAIEREAATLPDEAREVLAKRIQSVMKTAADWLVLIRDEVKMLSAKGGDDE
jgi:hypothetical protein